MNPAFVGPYLFEAVEENHMYKVPHMHTHEQIRARHRRIESDLEREEALHGAFLPQCVLCCAQIQGQNCGKNAQGNPRLGE